MSTTIRHTHDGIHVDLQGQDGTLAELIDRAAYAVGDTAPHYPMPVLITIYDTWYPPQGAWIWNNF